MLSKCNIFSSFTQIDDFFIVLGKTDMSFTQIDDFFADLGKTQLLSINYKTG